MKREVMTEKVVKAKEVIWITSFERAAMTERGYYNHLFVLSLFAFSLFRLDNLFCLDHSFVATEKEKIVLLKVISLQKREGLRRKR
jgi:hypothetical protein